MEENLKIVHTKNLNKHDFSLSFNLNVDKNTNVKTILNTNSQIYDLKCECGNGKAIISGKALVKILFLDTDNIPSTITDQQSFSETYLENSITTNTYLNLNSPTIIESTSLSDGNIKVNCDISFNPTAYINLPIANNIQTNSNLITQKRELNTSSLKEVINTKSIAKFLITININSVIFCIKIISVNTTCFFW